LYYVVYFKLQGSIKEVFVADAMEATLVNHRVFMYQHAHDAKVTSTGYRRANGIPSPSSNDIDNP
jgi:hypothetical protein